VRTMSDEGIHILIEEAKNVKTSDGIKDLPISTKIGGNPSDYIILEEDKEVTTEDGTVVVSKGEKIDCLPADPGMPHICGA